MNENERLQWEKSISKEKNNVDKYSQIQERAEKFEAEGDLDYAFHLYGLALDTAREMRDIERVGDTLIDIGKICLGLGKIDDALSFFKQAAEIEDEAQDSRTKHIGRIMTQFFEKTGDRPHAVESIRRAAEAGNIQRAAMMVREEPATTRTIARIQDIPIRKSNPSTSLRVSSQAKQIKRNKMAVILINYIVSIVVLIAVVGASLTIVSLLPNSLGVTLIVILVIIVFVLNRKVTTYINEDKGK